MINFPLHDIRKSIDGTWQQALSVENRIVPGSTENYTLSLIEVPDDGSVNNPVSIPNFTQSNTYPPATDQFYVNYNTGYIEFNPNNENDNIQITYYAKGSLIETADINYIFDHLADSKTKQVDRFIVDSTILNNRYIELSTNPHNNEHVNVFYNGLLLDDVDDYNMTSNGTTKITFLPLFVITISDKIIVKYKY